MTSMPFFVSDEGDMRKYRTELPNLVDDAGLSVYAFRLYAHFKRVAGASGSGRCWQGTKKLVECCKMSAGKISAAKQELVKAHLIAIEREQGPTQNADVITILDIWPANFAAYAHPKQSENPAAPPSWSEHPPFTT